MTTDSERREVAARLRDSAEERMAAKGRGNGNSWGWLYRSIFGHYMGTEKGAKGHYVEVAHRLADLIDPDCEEGRYSVARTARPVDRDALLSLAEDVDEAAAMAAAIDSSTSAKLLADMLLDIARRIREALGVE